MQGLVAKDPYWVGEEILAEKVERILRKSKPKAYYSANRMIGQQSALGRFLRLGTGARGRT